MTERNEQYAIELQVFIKKDLSNVIQTCYSQDQVYYIN